MQNHSSEIWKDVEGYKGLYQVSDQGRVKSLARIVPMSDGRKYRVSEKILNPAWDGHYFHVILSASRAEKTHLVHRLMLEAFVGPCPEGMESRHLDGNAENNRLDNLCWDTHDENMKDKIRHGTSTPRIPRGPGHAYKMKGRVGELLALWDSGKLTISEIARKFEVSFASAQYHIKKHRIRGDLR